MQILKSKECMTRQTGAYFRHSVLGPIVLLCILLAVLHIYLCLWMYGGLAIRLFVVFMGLFLAFAILVNFLWLRATIAKTNWIACVSTDGFYVNLRSYLNSRNSQLQDDTAYIPFHEIRHVHKTSVRSEEKDAGKTIVRWQFYLDIVLHHEETASLLQAIKILRDNEATQKSRWNHRAVSLPNDQTVRMDWTGKKMLRALEYYVQVAPTLTIREGEHNLEEAILRQIEAGHHIAAIRMVRQQYDMGLAEAKSFVEELAKTNTE